MFLIKFLFLGLKFAKATLFRCFSFSFTVFQIIYLGYLKNEYAYAKQITGYAYLIFMGSRI